MPARGSPLPIYLWFQIIAGWEARSSLPGVTGLTEGGGLDRVPTGTAAEFRVARRPSTIQTL